MKFDVIIHNAINIQDIFSDPLENDAIQVDGLAEDEAGDLARILTNHDVGVCLIPRKE
jgi:hypothetical protein|nr:MAG TPA: hypothetical protein [Bacteriophage sp.]DAW12808.1 MAG TPA: hypothetical protein [Caudoviricetes sp.]